MLDSGSSAAEYWWNQALECLAAAESEYEADRLSFCVNRLYYAAFYSVTSILLERGMHFRKHSGVRSAFHRELVKTGIVGKESGIPYDQLFADRQEGDYMPFAVFSKDEVSELLGRTRKFLSDIRKLQGSR